MFSYNVDILLGIYVFPWNTEYVIHGKSSIVMVKEYLETVEKIIRYKLYNTKY